MALDGPFVFQPFTESGLDRRGINSPTRRALTAHLWGWGWGSQARMGPGVEVDEVLQPQIVCAVLGLWTCDVHQTWSRGGTLHLPKKGTCVCELYEQGKARWCAAREHFVPS